MANGNMDNYAAAMFEKEVVACGDPIEIARKVKLAFKKMSGEMALACFACPCIERELLRLGVDPNHRNNLGLCWNDIRRHLIRPEV